MQTVRPTIALSTPLQSTAKASNLFSSSDDRSDVSSIDNK